MTDSPHSALADIIKNMIGKTLSPMTAEDIRFQLATDGHELGIACLYALLQELRRQSLIAYAPITATEIREARAMNPAYDALLTDRDDIRDYIWEFARYVANPDNSGNEIRLFQ